MSNFIDSVQQQRLDAAFAAGLSIRAAARHADVAKNTAMRYFGMKPPMICPCGKALPHREWCEYRIAMSPKRQAFLARFVPIKADTIVRWSSLKTTVLDALGTGAYIATLDRAAMSDLRRFYDIRPTALEYSGDQPRFVAVADPMNDEPSFALFAALEQLHPIVRNFCHAIIDGAAVTEAAAEAGVSNEQLAVLLPRLKTFLKPYVSR